MIKINWVEPQSTSWERWKARCVAKTADTIQRYNAGDRPKATKLYKQQKSAIARMFHGKCAFCEKKILSTQHGDVDHFRPKDAVSEEDWTRVHFQRDGRTGEHLGYYWLTYDPANLILCCISCNQVAARREWGKGTRFPVIGFRAELAGEELQENPKLLDPYNDDPEHHLAVDNTGIFSVVGNSEKGRATREIVGLNQRGLPTERAAKFQATVDRMNILWIQRNQVGIAETLLRLQRLWNTDEEFAAVTRTAANQFLAEMEVLTTALGTNDG